MIELLETTRFRVGNAEYARLNRSFGISTLRGRHATVSGATVRFRFRGKGGRTEERAIVDRRLATIVGRCQDLPGQELFQYVDDDGEPRPISSEDVNDYLREAAGSDEFSAKDFRTWTATVLAHRALREALDGGDVDIGAAGGLPKRIVAEALQRTAEALGDTVTVTKSSYVHPAVLEPDPRRGAVAHPAARRAARRGATAGSAAAIGGTSWPCWPCSAPPPRPARRSIARGRSATRRSSRPAA